MRKGNEDSIYTFVFAVFAVLAGCPFHFSLEQAKGQSTSPHTSPLPFGRYLAKVVTNSAGLASM
jgi:hypothetical protein